MSRTRLAFVVSVLMIPSLPLVARAQVNPPHFVNTATGELMNERRHNSGWGQFQRLRSHDTSYMMRESLRRQRGTFAQDACGPGCSDHEGLKVQRIPGTYLSVALYRVRLDDDVLTVQLRFHNDGVVPAQLTMGIPPAALEWFYVQVGEEKIHILTDDDGGLESKGAVDVVLQPGEMESWWARFPAPPSDSGTFDLHVPEVTFPDVPLEDT